MRLYSNNSTLIESIGEDKIYAKSSFSITRKDIGYVVLKYYSILNTDNTVIEIWKNKGINVLVSVICISISAVLIVGIVLLTIRYYRRHIQQLETKSGSTKNLSNKFDNECTKVKYKSSEDKFNTGCCTICQCPFKQLEEIIQLKCDHFFHDTCIREWVSSVEQSKKEIARCPNCNLNFI